MKLVAPRALINGQLESNVYIESTNGIISAIEVNSELPTTISGVVLPGFVDIHTHGGGGYYFSAVKPENISAVIDTHSSHGTTSMLASLVTEPLENLFRQIEALVPFINKSSIKGIHLEGPYLAHSHCGAHDPALLRVPNIEELEQLIAASNNSIRMVTIAPELDGAIPVIEFLRNRGVVVALGHSGADAASTKAAIKAGATVITHFNNGMPKLDSGDNISSASLNNVDVSLEIILDGVHINKADSQRILDAAPHRVIAVTDAMSAAGSIDGEYTIGKLGVRVKDGIARLTTNEALAGSTLTMDQAFLNLVNIFGFSIAEASYAASTLPAEIIGLDDSGSVEVGKRAEIIEFKTDGTINPI